MNERQEGFGEFVVTSGDASELLDTSEETFDQIAALVEVPIERTWVEPIGTRRDHRLAALSGDCFDEGIRVVALVGHNEFGRLPPDQGFGLLDIRDLPRRENHPQWVAQGIDRDVQFGRQSGLATDRFPERLLFFGARRVLVGSNDSRVDKQLLQISIAA